MARNDLKLLYQKLLKSEFDFVPIGEHSLQALYNIVQNRFPTLCDDDYLCRTNCKSGNNSPEWQHVVRKALYEMQRRQSTKAITGSQRGYWLFTGSHLSPVASDIVEVPSERVATTTYRIVRDTALSKRLKLLHGNQCQICGQSIPLPNDQTYSEAHHIRPLGEPHNGPDVEENILILCPNHHAMYDYGSIRLDLRKLNNHPDHRIDQEFINYHNTIIASA